jgi:hypothetical protein
MLGQSYIQESCEGFEVGDQQVQMEWHGYYLFRCGYSYARSGCEFPRYKFFLGQWMVYSEDRRSLSSLVLKHCAGPNEADREDAWDRVVAPMIAKKYADMHCNINNDVRKAFQGMRCFVIFLSASISHQFLCY